MRARPCLTAMTFTPSPKEGKKWRLKIETNNENATKIGSPNGFAQENENEYIQQL